MITTEFEREKVGDENIPCAEDVLKFIAFMCFQPGDPYKPEKLNGYLKYLKGEYNVQLVDAELVTGSLAITVQCSCLLILYKLWEDYETGRLNEVAQRFLVTKDILEVFGLAEVKLMTTIEKDEYKACQEYLERKGMKEYKILHTN